MLYQAKRGFTGMTKDFRNAAALALHNAIIQIFKEPIQPPPERPADAAFSRAHKTNQKHSPAARNCHGQPLRQLARPGVRLATLAGSIRISFRGYFAARFLRWILPLKLRRTTVEETAARPMVPMKARPCSIGDQLCDLGWSGMSSCTSPLTEWALTSAEVPSGTMASMSPL